MLWKRYGKTEREATHSEHDRAFKTKEKFFRLDSGGIPSKRSVVTNNAVTGDENWERIASVRGADSTEPPGNTDAPGKLFVRDRRSVRNLAQLPPDTLLESRANLIVRNGKLRELSIEIARQLLDNLPVPAFVLDDIIIVEMNGEPSEKIFLRFPRNADLAYTSLSRGDVDLSYLGIEGCAINLGHRRNEYSKLPHDEQ
jgi:hypothetical protein